MPRSSSQTRKRKFHGNQFSDLRRKLSKENESEEGTSRRLSASGRKVELSQTKRKSNTSNAEQSVSKINGYRFINMEILAKVFQNTCCVDCGASSMMLAEVPFKRKGCSSYLRLLCTSCGWKHCFYTSKKVNKYFEVNRRIVYGMRTIGQGSTSAKRFCGMMDMPPPPKPKAYARHNKALLKATKTVAADTMTKAGIEIHELKVQEDDGIVHCGVSSDGTWQRRGYSSMNGCVTTITMDTGKCIDVEVLSKVCHTCQRHEQHQDNNEERVWQAEHARKCTANFTGSAPAMETVGVTRIFKRSEEKHKIRYTEYFGDGDSKGYAEVKNTYKDKGVDVVKKECIGHVQKRVGSALRKLKKSKKGMGGRGKLTDSMIDKLQNYYGIAIRSNIGNLNGMKKTIYASLFHCASSKERNLHDHCPKGSDSWCRYHKDIADKTKHYKPGPGLPVNIIQELKPIFLRLSNDELLGRCLDGKTQNQNESLNGMIWDRLPKGVFVGPDVLHLGVYDAVAHFNVGCQAAVNVLTSMGMEPGALCLEELSGADKLRVNKGNYKAGGKNKKKRKILRAKRKQKGDKAHEKEGLVYEAGSF